MWDLELRTSIELGVLKVQEEVIKKLFTTAERGANEESIINYAVIAQ